ncbi:hypothetical protein [Streptomyces sp. NPDC001820]|uniref:hypothetical protein n=1 Tax=Streptomyces sp. NPDC001820 TaxID=3364613 RepID=UPI003695CF3C
MFDIRIICDEVDTPEITKTLAETFILRAIRQLPTRNSHKIRLYVAADQRPQPLTPHNAYALAPSIVSEIGWTANAAASRQFGQQMGREFWLRKAAVLDRIALVDGDQGIQSDAAEVAADAARRLIDLDRATGYDSDPRSYVRNAYADWRRHQ